MTAKPAPKPPKRPSASMPIMTGVVGLGALIATTILLRGDPYGLGVEWAGMLALGLITAAMVATEILVRLGGYHQNCDEVFVAPNMARLRTGLNRDLAIKFYGLAIIFLVLAFVYANAPIYRHPDYQFFLKFTQFLAIWLALPGVLYVWVTHALMAQPRDSLWHLGRFFLPGGRAATNATEIRHQALSWVIKGFFLPLMLTYYLNGWRYLDNNAGWFGMGDAALTFPNFYRDLYEYLFFIDTAFITIGYMMTLKLLNTHIRWPEDRGWAWVVTLICYAPINTYVLNSFITYDDQFVWGSVYEQMPFWYVVWGSAILILLSIYAWASVCAGLRFSNLTFRGVITFGPYAFSKHPAYLSKNLSWWLIEMPFIATSPLLAVRNCLMLLAFNGVYMLRARYEEQMLSRDPVYKAYLDYMNTYGGWWPRLKRFAAPRLRRLGFILEMD